MARSRVVHGVEGKRNKISHFMRVRISRRLAVAIFLLGVLLTPVCAYVYARYWEPQWLRVRKVKVEGLGALRILQISDLHYEGDSEWMEKVIRTVNAQKVDFVCFTGDLVSIPEYFNTAVHEIQRIKHPVYGVPGNHDYGRGRELPPLDAALRKTGGGLLLNASARVKPGVVLVGFDEASIGHPDVDQALSGVGNNGDEKVICLFHEPEFVHEIPKMFSLALAGHSHGGQVRIPLYGAPVLPFMVGKYDWGLYRTPQGPLYVSNGVGTYGAPFRFWCRPEIVLLTGE